MKQTKTPHERRKVKDMVVAKNIPEQQYTDPGSSSPEVISELPEAGVPPVLGLSVDDQLALSQASRVNAESERQRVAKGIVDATKQACQELIADGEKVLKKAKWLESEAERKHQAADTVINKANTARAEADAYSQKVKSDADAFRSDAESQAERAVAEAQHQAKEILERARAVALRECAEFRQQAAFEAKQMLGQAQVIRTAAREELEAHRIYVEAARLNSESHEVLVRSRTKSEEPPQHQSPGSTPRWQGLDEGEELKSIANQLGAIRKKTSKAAKLTAKPKAAKLTAKPKATKLTAKPKATKLTAKAKATKLTVKPKATKLTVKPKATKLTVKPKATKLTVKPKATKLTVKAKPTKLTVKAKPTKITAKPKAAKLTVKPKAAKLTVKAKPTKITAKPKAAKLTVRSKTTKLTAKLTAESNGKQPTRQAKSRSA